MLATLLAPALILPILVNAVPLQPRSPLLDAVSANVGEQDTSFIPTSSTTGSNDGLALIARGLFDTFQYHSDGSTPSTNNEAPPPSDDARSANVAPEVDETKPTSLSSIEATSTAQVESQSSVATLSTVDVSRPSPNQPNAEQNWYRFRDW